MLSSTSCANNQPSKNYMSLVNSDPNSTIDGSSDLINLNVPNQMGHNDTLDIYGSPFSPDDSSYSENSDYTSDEYDDSDNIHENQIRKYNNMTHPNLLVVNSTMNSQPSNTIPSSTSLPPFPTINANSTANINNHNTFISFSQSGHYASPLISSQQSFSPSYIQIQHQHQPIYNYSQMYQRHYISSNAVSIESNSINNTSLIVNSQIDNSIATTSSCQDDVQQYTDLSLSIASSSESLNGLLSSVNHSKDNGVTPVTLNIENQRNIQLNDGESQDIQQELNVDDCEHFKQQIQNESEQQDESDENFGEIIKKTMVETVNA